MDNRSWMYQDLSLGFEDFINFSLSNLKNISGNRIRCSCVKYKNKKYYQSEVVMMFFLKKKGS